ncbi:MAG: electron transporter RnfD [Flavobacteriaceae bacterium]|nr:electron transporter RnfD [Flavobacteriaceae bacterium]
MKNHFYLWIVFLLVLSSCKTSKVSNESNFISSKNSDILYTGRVNFEKDSMAILYWPGTSIKIRFKGTDLKMIMKDAHKKNYYNIILDGKKINILNPDSVKTSYNLVSGISNTEHTIEIFKRTEWNQGSTYFYGFETGKGTKILSTPKISKKTIEFFGNSITAGYANEDFVGDSPDSIYTNNYLTYGALTARHFNANYYCTARGGIGITISWYRLIMDDMYNRLDPKDPSSKWDFSRVTPDIVVINLFQNDSWLVERPDFPEFKHQFKKTKPTKEFIISKYVDFLKKIRTEYPKAKIICTLGTMDATKEGSVWPGYVESAVKQMNDSEIFTLFFPYQNYKGHPEINTHKEMADSLIQFIEKNNLFN